LNGIENKKAPHDGGAYNMLNINYSDLPMAIAHPNNPGMLTTTATTIFVWVMKCHLGEERFMITNIKGIIRKFL
jgi:hypothetical protein